MTDLLATSFDCCFFATGRPTSVLTAVAAAAATNTAVVFDYWLTSRTLHVGDNVIIFTTTLHVLYSPTYVYIFLFICIFFACFVGPPWRLDLRRFGFNSVPTRKLDMTSWRLTAYTNSIGV